MIIYSDSDISYLKSFCTNEGKRDTSVVCYDLTNDFFDWEKEHGHG